MFHLVVLSAFLAIAFAAPSGHHHHDLLAYSAPLTKTLIHEPIYTGYEKTLIQPEVRVIEEPTVHHVGNIVKSVPTAVSHQSQTIVHSKANIVEPIIAHGVQQTLIETPHVEKHYVSAPAYNTVVEDAHLDDTVVVDARYADSVYDHSPLAKSVYAHAPLAKTVYSHAPAAVYSHAPLTKTLSYSHAPVAHAPLARTVVAHGPALAYSAKYSHDHLPLTYSNHHAW